MGLLLRATDHGAVRLLRDIARSPALDVGVLGTKAGARHPGSRATVAEIASWNEFGTKTIPARSFIGAWFDASQVEMTAFVRQATALYLHGKITDDQFIELVGLKAQGGIQKRMAQGIAPPNAASTIARKKSSTPLIDKGTLRSSITFRRAAK